MAPPGLDVQPLQVATEIVGWGPPSVVFVVTQEAHARLAITHPRASNSKHTYTQTSIARSKFWKQKLQLARTIDSRSSFCNFKRDSAQVAIIWRRLDPRHD